LTALSLRARLAAFYALTLAAVVCAFGANVWWMEGRLGLRRVDRELTGMSLTAAGLLEHERGEHEPLPSAAAEASQTAAPPDRAIVVFNRDGHVVAAQWGGLDGSALPSPVTEVSLRTVATPLGGWRVRTQPMFYGDTPIVLLVASSLREVDRQRHEVVETMWVALPIALLVAGGGGWWMARRALRPITEMARQAAAITINGTDTVGDSSRRDELGVFATAFNGLLARQRDALHRQRQFMADASHELRTPVSVVRTAADVALGRPSRDEHEYRESLSIIGTQARRLSRLVDSMLVLARADGGGYPVRSVDLYLDEIVTECCRAVAMLCEERQVAIRGGPWPETPFRGDEELLRQLVLNVLQNAVQHTTPGSAVDVKLTATAGGVTIAVSDHGPGIAAADRARIFGRFVRLDAARTGNGAGLGLPIARWIAEAHGGSLVLAASGPDGSTFRIDLVHQSVQQGERSCDTTA
jgi:signal transduction histidine kinase